MNQNEFVPQIPYGTRDFLPREASRKRAIEAALAGMFVRWGYDEVVTPTIEYLDTLTLGQAVKFSKICSNFLIRITIFWLCGRI